MTEGNSDSPPTPRPLKGVFPLITGLLGTLPSIVVLVVGLLGGTGISGAGFWVWNTVWDNPHVYSAGSAAGYTKARAEDQAAAAAQAAEIAKIKANTEQQLADVSAIIRKEQENDLNEITSIDAENAADPHSADLCWSPGIMHHYRNIWAGQH